MAKKAVAYDEQAILTLDALAHIRLRTGMYIGRIGDGAHPQDGIYVMLKEIIDNAIDEFIMGFGKSIDISLMGEEVTVRDYGRGIPLGKVIDCVSKINTGGKYNDDVFQFSVGLNGVGTKAVNALSSEFEVISYREGRYKRAIFQQGKLLQEQEGKDAKAPSGTFIRFIPDKEIFKRFKFEEEFIAQRLRYYAYLNSGLSLRYQRGADGAAQIFKSERGLQDLLNEELGGEPALYESIYYKGEHLEFAFTHTHNFGENYLSFVNGQYTNDGGTHRSAFREGILKAVNEFTNKNYAGEDVREGIVGTIAIKMQDPVFESQTKNKLGSTEVRSWIVPAVKDFVLRFLHQNAEVAESLLAKVHSNERIRRELASIKKEARERAKKVAIRIPKLIDCKVHYNDPKDNQRFLSTIFITEGDSAGGAMVQARDVYTQAIFALKGKPLNCHGLPREVIYKNEELYNIMRALGIEDDEEGLRYNKVVIATDADVDGMHIRNLLLTYFLRYFEGLVVKGHVYILETPLFRVRNKKLTEYCYSEVERDAAIKKLSPCEVTRFKGLGEISPQEFKQFISGEMRLLEVRIRSLAEISQSLDFFMGKNTPKRKEFIVQNLLADIA